MDCLPYSLDPGNWFPSARVNSAAQMSLCDFLSFIFLRVCILVRVRVIYYTHEYLIASSRLIFVVSSLSSSSSSSSCYTWPGIMFVTLPATRVFPLLVFVRVLSAPREPRDHSSGRGSSPTRGKGRNEPTWLCPFVSFCFGP